MTLMAAFHALLFRYTGQADLAVGTPIANRTRADVEPLIGFFVNTLVIRTRPGRELTFRELLGQVREVTLGAYAHQDLPFEKLVEELHPERTLSHNPLFQVMFVLQNAPAQAAAAVAASPPEPQPTLSKFDLTLSFSEHPDGLRGTVEYSTDLFDHATVTRLIGHLTTLLADAAASPERRLPELALLTEPERRRLLVEWNDTRAGYPDGACVHELIEAQVDRAPETKAVVFQDRSLTYRELDERANRLARRLIALGVGPEVKVGLCVERSLEMVVGALAILKAGGAYLPLDPTHPPRRLASILDQARAPVLVATRHSGPALPQHGARVLLADEPGEGKAGRPARTATPDALAYVIHSSGSTGTPKGIEVPHRGLCNLAADLGRRFGVKPGERALQFFSPSFDAWMWDVLLALPAGATLHVAPDEARMSGPRLVEMLARDRIQVATLLPSLLALMPRVALPDLHTLITGGEVCSTDLVAAWAPGRRFFNTYGPTEVSIAATIARCEPGGRRPTIGRPISNTTAYVLDEGLSPIPIGVAGELYLGGCGVARGYLDRPDLTRERFLPDPFSTDPRGRLFRTGDRARLTVAGEIEFLGRADEQVKLRGVRIELGEIEAALRRHPSIGEAAVVIRDAGPDERRLLAYVAPAAGQAVVPGALRGFLRETLPAHMVPARFTVLERLPRLASGKIDARALPEPAPPDHAEGGLVEPRTPAEREVAGIWRQVLGVARVGVHDNFFDLGGHSLAATRVLSQIRERWNVDLPLIRFFDAPTVAELAQQVSRPSTGAVGDLERQGAASLLARVDELSGPEVDALLEALGTPSPAAAAAAAAAVAEPGRGPPPSAGALLEQIDDLSDERVNALLTELMEAEAR
jgi:amino acid adenylation domain-containing protein